MSKLREIAHKHKARKYEWYIDAYEAQLGHLEPKTLLEIGIAFGGSARMWQEYFPSVKYYAIDIKPPKLETSLEKLFIGHQADKKLLRQVGKEIGQIDIVIDDGSHHMKDQQTSFEGLFPYVSPGGWYIIEDLHTAYWPSYHGGYRKKHNTIEYLKGIVDSLNSRWFLDDKRAKEYKQGGKRNHIHKMVDGKIESMCFYDSMCFIKKA